MLGSMSGDTETAPLPFPCRTFLKCNLRSGLQVPMENEIWHPLKLLMRKEK